jgi:hypothetical protein
MNEPVILKPAGKNLVRNPDTGGHLSATGEPIVMTAYWRRRIKDGDVKEVEAAKEQK